MTHRAGGCEALGHVGQQLPFRPNPAAAADTATAAASCKGILFSCAAHAFVLLCLVALPCKLCLLVAVSAVCMRRHSPVWLSNWRRAGCGGGGGGAPALGPAGVAAAAASSSLSVSTCATDRSRSATLPSDGTRRIPSPAAAAAAGAAASTCAGAASAWISSRNAVNCRSTAFA